MPDASELQSMQFGGGTAGSIFSPVALAIILLVGILIFVLPRSKAIAPLFAAAILIPYDQILLIGPAHLPMLRVLMLFGFARLIKAKFSGEVILEGGINGIDKAVLVFGLFSALDGVLLWRESGAVVYQFGQLFTNLGAYFVLRYFIRSEDDVLRVIRAWAYVAIVIAFVMAGEQLLRRNLIYFALGGARASLSTFTGSRDGSLRATGCFQHPILAGTFGGFSLPLFVGLRWKQDSGKLLGLLGIIACVVITLSASSSTSLLGAIAGIVALCAWPLRQKMKTVRWGFIGFLFAAQLYMTSPVWHLISDIDITGSSSSYHRYMLVDQCIRHIFSWALVGAKDYGTWGWDMWDLSDQYVAVADTSGLIPLVAIISMLVLGFKYLGRMRRFVEERVDKKQELFLWAVCSSLFANLVAFFGISYFDQTIVAWYALLCIIVAVTLPVRMPGMVLTAPPVAVAAPGGKLVPGWNRPKIPASASSRLSPQQMASTIEGTAFANDKSVQKYR